MTSSPEPSPVGTPLSTQAPKYGTLIPNRIFVGGIPANTLDSELKQFFSVYGAVKDCKIIADRAGVSKGYGFVTFETQEDAEKIRKKEADNLIFKDRKLNIGPAIRKQAFPRLYEPSISPNSTILYSNGVPYTFQNGMAVFQPPEGYAVPAQPQPSYPMMMSPNGGTSSSAQQVYMPSSGYHAYQTQNALSSTPNAWTTAAAAAAAAAAGQWRWAQQSPTQQMANQYVYTSMPELMYAQHGQAAAYQATDLADASMMEAAAPPSEGSILLEGTIPVPTRYAEGHVIQYAPDASLATPQRQQLLTHVQPKSTPTPGMTFSSVMKRPLNTPRGVMVTPPPTPGSHGILYSQRDTPPIKIMSAQGQRIITKMERSEEIPIMSGLITPPSTPHPEL